MKASKSTKRKPRQQSRRYCPKCEASITSTDVEVGYGIEAPYILNK